MIVTDPLDADLEVAQSLVRSMFQVRQSHVRAWDIGPMPADWVPAPNPVWSR